MMLHYRIHVSSKNRNNKNSAIDALLYSRMQGNYPPIIISCFLPSLDNSKSNHQVCLFRPFGRPQPTHLPPLKLRIEVRNKNQICYPCLSLNIPDDATVLCGLYYISSVPFPSVPFPCLYRGEYIHQYNMEAITYFLFKGFLMLRELLTIIYDSKEGDDYQCLCHPAKYHLNRLQSLKIRSNWLILFQW
ncbi:MAG: hypothetical protein ACI8RD_011096 [Bacillariaceae sp.]|jgi:hypothetical protein